MEEQTNEDGDCITMGESIDWLTVVGSTLVEDPKVVMKSS